MKKQLTSILKILIYLGLFILALRGAPAARIMAQESTAGPVQLVSPAPLSQQSTFVGPGIEANSSSPETSQLLSNPGFENGGWSPWETYGTPTLDGSVKRSGSQSARLGNINSANDQIIQTVTIPANASAVTLDFWFRLATGETDPNADFFCYGLWDQSGATALVERCLDLGAAGSSQEWSQETYNLTAEERAEVLGQTVLLTFVVQTNVALPSQVWIDDTALTVATPSEPPSTQSKIFLPIAIKTLATTTPPPPDGEDSDVFWLPYTSATGDLLPTYAPSVAVDNAGGIHVGYAIYTNLDNGQRPAYYVYCAANCTNPANWSRTRLSDFVQEVRLALDPAGHPRMLLYTSGNPNLPENDHEYQYAACESDCTNSANWTITVPATVNEIPSQRSNQNNRYFALDSQGHPAFVFTDAGGTVYAYCGNNCTNAENWFTVPIANNQWASKPVLTFTPAGDPRLLIDFWDADNTRHILLFIGCDTLACNNLRGRFLVTNTASSAPATVGDAYFSLRTDTNGQPRIALYTGETVTPPLQLTSLHYLWCNTDCLNPDADTWNLVGLGLPDYHGEGVDMVLDSANRPRLAYEMGGEGLGYAWCNTNCESANPNWQHKTVESTTAIVAQYPSFPPYSCPIQTWFNGKRVSVALDPAGNPRVGYDAEHWWGGYDQFGNKCNVEVSVTRFALFNQP